MASRKYVRQRKKSTYIEKGTGFKIKGKSKARGVQKVKTERQKLYANTKKAIDIVNKRLRNLERQGLKGTWASKKLFDRLDMKDGISTKRDKRGTRLVIDKDLTNTQLRLINKASKQFLASKTSTSRGISQVKNETLETLKRTLPTGIKNIDESEVEFYYNMLNDRDFRQFADKGKASTVWNIIADYKDLIDVTDMDKLSYSESIVLYNETKSNFISSVSKHTNVQLDDDMIDMLGRIFDNNVL